MTKEGNQTGTDQAQAAMGESLASLLQWMLQQARATAPTHTQSYVSIKFQMGVLRTWCARAEAALDAVLPLDPPPDLHNDQLLTRTSNNKSRIPGFARI